MLREVPHVDHIYLTGGDGQSSHRRPDLMFDALARFAPEARKIHPNLGIWTSNQGADDEQNNWFSITSSAKSPNGSPGSSTAPGTVSSRVNSARTLMRYPIRRYPDIGHCVRAQYTVPEWDRAFALPRTRALCAPPRGQANIHNLYDEYCDGFVTYSDGIGDDVNKFVWTALGWDPDRALDDILLDYARFSSARTSPRRSARDFTSLKRTLTSPCIRARAWKRTTNAGWRSMRRRTKS